MKNTNCFQHFILTRFNLLLWSKDKKGNKVRSLEWLEHRFRLFELYCLPSVKNQTCKDFVWIVLFDSSTPDRFKERVIGYQKECPQLYPVFVAPENGRRFAEFFLYEVVKQLWAPRVITSYLDNDDALNVRFVEDLQARAKSVEDGTFIYYTNGYQFFTDYQYLMQIHYPRNHFVSVVENGDGTKVKTIYGYGSHYYIDKIKDAKIEYVSDCLMWCQVVHEKNMGNDAYFLGARMVWDENLLFSNFCISDRVNSGLGLYLFHFLPRYIRTFLNRCKIRLRGYRFE